MNVSCVICAYNEAPRIGAVLNIVSKHPLISEVIVVDDGSTDGTGDTVKQYPNVRLISYTPNKGKSNAFVEGVTAARHPILLLLDADLIGLQNKDITLLLEPVFDGKVDVCISLRSNSLLVYKLMGIDFVSGDRAVSRDFILRYIDEYKLLPGFGLEFFMNECIREEKLRTRIIKWHGVAHARKAEKMNSRWHGQLAELKMLGEIRKVASFWKIVRQHHYFISFNRSEKRRLRKKASAERSRE
ncbi:MAG: glycosyltransferase [Minisyncoccia bacterium]